MKKDIIERPTSDISENLDIRDKILKFESTLKSIDNKDIIVVTDKNSEQLCPLTHKFFDGIYVREIL